jgi:hypothetical protein
VKTRTLGVIVLALLVVACGDSSKGVADAAVTALASSYEALKDEAAKYLPADQSKAIDRALATVKETLSKGEYMKVVSDVEGLSATLKDARAAIAAKKVELSKTWDEASGRMPDVLQSIEKKLTALSKAKKLPDGVKKESVDAGKAGLARLETTWSEATAAFKSANLAEAASKASLVKKKAAEIMDSLGMPVPGFLR